MIQVRHSMFHGCWIIEFEDDRTKSNCNGPERHNLGKRIFTGITNPNDISKVLDGISILFTSAVDKVVVSSNLYEKPNMQYSKLGFHVSLGDDRFCFSQLKYPASTNNYFIVQSPSNSCDSSINRCLIFDQLRLLRTTDLTIHNVYEFCCRQMENKIPITSINQLHYDEKLHRIVVLPIVDCGLEMRYGEVLVNLAGELGCDECCYLTKVGLMALSYADKTLGVPLKELWKHDYFIISNILSDPTHFELVPEFSNSTPDTFIGTPGWSPVG